MTLRSTLSMETRAYYEQMGRVCLNLYTNRVKWDIRVDEMGHVLVIGSLPFAISFNNRGPQFPISSRIGDHISNMFPNPTQPNPLAQLREYKHSRFRIAVYNMATEVCNSLASALFDPASLGDFERRYSENVNRQNPTSDKREPKSGHKDDISAIPENPGNPL